jgi:hypothetical protein
MHTTLQLPRKRKSSDCAPAELRNHRHGDTSRHASSSTRLRAARDASTEPLILETDFQWLQADLAERVHTHRLNASKLLDVAYCALCGGKLCITTRASGEAIRRSTLTISA